jgi:hypothetical protein
MERVFSHCLTSAPRRASRPGGRSSTRRGLVALEASDRAVVAPYLQEALGLEPKQSLGPKRSFGDASEILGPILSSILGPRCREQRRRALILRPRPYVGPYLVDFVVGDHAGP